MGFTNYWDKKVLNAAFGHDTIPSLTTYFALFSTAPTAASGGTEFSFTSSYARVNFSSMASATNAGTANSTTITFPTNTATGGPWGTASCFAVLDAATGGNMLFWATLTTAKSIATGDVAQFATGSLTVALT
jgi:hypothetical protein